MAIGEKMGMIFIRFFDKLLGYMVTSLHGYRVAWLHGYMVIWLIG